MNVLQIRKAVLPDIVELIRFDHSLKTSCVWQMQQNQTQSGVITQFIETQLPRQMRINYPQSPEMLEARWGDLSVIFIGCIDNAPVSYISINSFFSPHVAWIKDLVVDEIWREKGIAASLINAAIEWAKERSLDKMTFEISSKNYPAICLANKLNFEYSGFNDNYFKNGDIALFFTRNLRKRIGG